MANKKYLDEVGLAYILDMLSNYPNNEILAALIDALQDALDEKLNTTDISNWAKASSKPSYTANEVGALPSNTTYVSSVNNQNGAVTVDKVKTTAGDNLAEYNLIGTAANNTNISPEYLYNPNLINFSKYTDNFARLTLGSTSTPGVVRLYTKDASSSGYTDINTNVSSTNTRTVTLPDASGTVALTSDIPNVPSWALSANKPNYTAAEVGAITSADASTMISNAVGNITGFDIQIVQSLPATGATGTFYFVANSGSGDNIYDEYLYVNNNWEKIGSLNGNNIDLTGYLTTSDIAAWAKAANKPSYTAAEVGALPANTTYVSTFNGQSGAVTYIPPVSSVNGQTGVVEISIPTTVSSFTNDAGYLTLATLPKYDGTVI